MSRRLIYTPHLKEKAEEHRGTVKRKYLLCGGHIDIRVVTLKSHYIDEIYDIAFDAADGDISKVQGIASSLMKTQTLKVREFVEVEKDQIVVAIDVDKIDQSAEDRALQLLIEVEEIKNGVKKYFGDLVTFNYDEIT